MNIQAGKIVIIKGGKYNGQGAQIRKVYEKSVDVLINGKIVKLDKSRVCHE